MDGWIGRWMDAFVSMHVFAPMNGRIDVYMHVYMYVSMDFSMVG